MQTTILNKHLNEEMEGLTAKVFRTYNASRTLQEQLDQLTEEDMTVNEKVGRGETGGGGSAGSQHCPELPSLFGRIGATVHYV